MYMHICIYICMCICITIHIQHTYTTVHILSAQVRACDDRAIDCVVRNSNVSTLCPVVIFICPYLSTSECMC